MAIVWVLTINEPSEGGSVYGVYSTRELAEAAEKKLDYMRGFEYPMIHPVEVDAEAQPHLFDEDGTIMVDDG